MTSLCFHLWIIWQCVHAVSWGRCDRTGVGKFTSLQLHWSALQSKDLMADTQSD
jgi:hypothetical protein